MIHRVEHYVALIIALGMLYEVLRWTGERYRECRCSLKLFFGWDDQELSGPDRRLSSPDPIVPR